MKKRKSVEEFIKEGNKPRYLLHKFIGEQFGAEKLATMGNPNKSDETAKYYEKLVKDLLDKYPELEKAVDKVEEHFMKRYYP